MLPAGQQLEDVHVHNVYDAIAADFSLTRHTPWPKVCQFVLELPPWSVVYDVGCGNGRYLQQRHDIIALALDRCSGFAQLCLRSSLHAAQADCLQLPLRSSSCDALLSIAVLHHVSTPERRARAVHEIARVLVPGGVCCIHAWATEQGQESRRVFKGSDCLVPWTKSGCLADTGISTGISFSEASVDPNKKGGKVGGDGGGCDDVGDDDGGGNDDDAKERAGGQWRRGQKAMVFRRCKRDGDDGNDGNDGDCGCGGGDGGGGGDDDDDDDDVSRPASFSPPTPF
jgi:alkylated DNA repair protein alkB family protein 8